MGGVAWRCVHSDGNGHVFQAEHDNEVHREVSHALMEIEQDAPGFQHERNWHDVGEAKARLHANVPGLSHLPRWEQAIIQFRYEVVEEFLRLEKLEPDTVTRGDDPLDAVLVRIQITMDKRARLAADAGRRKRAGRKSAPSEVPSRKRLLELVNLLEEGNFNPIALRDRYEKCGNRTPRHTEEYYDLVEEYGDKWLVPRQPSIANVHGDMELDVAQRNVERTEKGTSLLKVPSYSKLCDYIGDLPEYEKVASREGAEEALRRFRPVGEGIQDVYRPFQHCEQDHWSVQLHTMSRKVRIWDMMADWQQEAATTARWMLGGVVCRRTRCFAGLRLTRTATARSAVELLDMAVSDKRDYALSAGAVVPWDIHGTMAWMYADGAYANHEYKTACAGLGVNVEIPPTGLAHMRGLIERSFRGMHQGVVSRFDGRTFENIIRKGDYDSEGRAGTFTDELGQALVRWAVDVHHNTPHPSLNWETPRECWLRLTKELGVDPSPDWHKRRHVFGIDLKATLGPSGLRFLNIQYRSERLHQHFLQHGHIEMDMRVDERNIGAISAGVNNGWLTVYGPPEFHGIRAETWVEAEADLRRRGYTTADVTAEIRLKAIDDINRNADRGRLRIGIDDARATALDLLTLQRRMSIGVDFPSEDVHYAQTAESDLYEGSFTVGETSGPASDFPERSAPADAPRAATPPLPSLPEEPAAAAPQATEEHGPATGHPATSPGNATAQPDPPQPVVRKNRWKFKE